MSFSIPHALLAGVVITAIDVACTLMFAVKPWTAELARQGLRPSPLTPPYYITANLIGGVILTWLYTNLAVTMSPGTGTALAASLVLWAVTRLYGGGHVVMGQMPVRIFAIMSTGLCIGYVVAGQLLARLG
jgi:hypothetical protein